MSISGYIATYVNRCRGGLRHRGALVLLAVVATVAAACVGTLPDVEIDPADLNPLHRSELAAPLSRGAGIPGQQSAQLHDAPLATIKEGPATAKGSPTEVPGPTATTSEAAESSEQLVA